MALVRELYTLTSPARLFNGALILTCGLALALGDLMPALHA